MAIGITKYVGAGSRPMKKVTESDVVFDPTEGGATKVTSTDTGSGGGTSGLYSYKSNLEKIAADQAAAQAAAERATRGATLQGGYLTGQLNQGVPQNLIDLLAGQKATGEQYITNQYDTLMKQLGGAYTRGQDLTTTGYNALQSYLQQNQPNTFAQARQATPTAATNDLAQYMGGQGVSTAPVDPTIAALNAAAGGGAQNYNALLATLGGLEQSNQQSRLSEAEMGRTLAGTQLAQGRATQEGSLQQQQLAAMAQLAADQASNRLTLEQQATARNQALQDALASLLGTGYLNQTSTDPAVQNILQTVVPGYVPPAVVEAPKPSAAVATLATQVANAKGSNAKALQTRANAWIAANPTATPAQVKEEFPNLTAAAAKKKKK
jgi:hypothetical protein